MGKNIDLIQILTLVIVAMFIPFLISIIINYRLDLSNIGDLIKMHFAGLFLLFFGIELIIVYLYFNITNLLAKKKMNNQKEK
ncbi:MAG: hypothetical protein LN408_05045 [Candidatus Thermoplasmatota archaeon]|nr:hypothetical protein [Candidatus Thermoplasmatota archaeon]